MNADATLAQRRPIRSFVLRQGRMSAAQKRALDEFAPRYSVAFSTEPLHLARVFGRRAPCVLEIGFGMGETTAAIAAAHRETDFIAVDVHGPGVGSLLKRIGELALDNVRIVRHDAVDVVAAMIPQASLSGIHVFFPDPWPKKRHHKRRLLQPDFVHALALRLAPGAYIHAVTDWEDYAEQILATFTACPLLENTADGFSARPAYRPQTKFEQRAIALGHRVRDIVFRRLRKR